MCVMAGKIICLVFFVCQLAAHKTLIGNISHEYMVNLFPITAIIQLCGTMKNCFFASLCIEQGVECRESICTPYGYSDRTERYSTEHLHVKVVWEHGNHRIRSNILSKEVHRDVYNIHVHACNPWTGFKCVV